MWGEENMSGKVAGCIVWSEALLNRPRLGCIGSRGLAACLHLRGRANGYTNGRRLIASGMLGTAGWTDRTCAFMLAALWS